MEDWNWKFDEFHGLIERCLTFFYCISSSQTRPFVHSYFLIPNTCLCIWPNISPQQLFITYYYLFLYALIPTYILYIKIYSIKDIPFYILLLLLRNLLRVDLFRYQQHMGENIFAGYYFEWEYCVTVLTIRSQKCWSSRVGVRYRQS